MTYLEAARKILQQARQPLHYEEIARRALEQGLIDPKGRTPSATMGSRLYTNTKLDGSFFRRAGRGIFELAQRQPGSIDTQVKQINAATVEQLRALLHSMPPARFEALITELLLQMGFDESTVTVTPYSNDGGIDVVGVYRAAGLTEVNAAVQVKRWKGNVQAPVVTQLRGSLQVHQQGIIITTSDFSSGARTEAAAPGKSRIGLINGDELLDLLVKHKVGVIEKTLTVTALDEEWWGELIGPPAQPDRALSSTGGRGQNELLEHPAATLTGRKPTAFTLYGELYPVASWRRLLIQVCTVLAQHYKEEFTSRAVTLQGKKWKYFSTSPDEMISPAAIPDSDLWVETHFSANDIYNLATRLLSLFDPDAANFTVELS